MNRRTRAGAALVANLLLLVGIAGCSGDDGADRSNRPVGTLEWHDCGDGVECATLRVPRGPESGSPKIALALARRPARSNNKRVGVLLLNPGGPGAEAQSLVRDDADIFSDAVRDRYDLVAWDPRGTGESTPIDCLSDHALDQFWNVDRSPDTRAEVRANVATAKSLANGCATRARDLLPYLGTNRTVDDMERVRVALGERVLNYLGFSYGTQIGAFYADKYPNRVGHFVLDGALDPARSSARTTREQTLGFEQALQEFLDACSNDSSCAFHSGGDAAGAYDKLSAAVDAEPLFAETNGESRELGPGEFDVAVAAALYAGRAGWPTLARGLQHAAQGDGSSLLTLADRYTGRGPKGRYDNENEAFYAIGCVDTDERPPLAEVENDAQALEADAPHFGASSIWLGLPCTYWRAPPDPPPTQVEAKGSAPILVLATAGDPVTPHAWGRALARELDSGVLVTYEGNSHTAFAQGSQCIDRIVDDFFVAGTVPAAGTSCS